MRDFFYFRHYMTELQEPNIAALFRRWGARGYGLYWYLLERLYSDGFNRIFYNEKLLSELAKSMKMRKLTVKLIIADMESLGLVIFDGNYMTSNRVENEIKAVLRSKSKKTGR